MITIVATLQAAPGKEDELRAALTEMVENVKEHEAGRALAYSLHTADKEPGVFMFYEQYADKAALDAHGTTPHMKAMGQKLAAGQLLAGRPSITHYTQIAGVS
ncbi:MAG: antibiotic biosynthesis monooxygenase [Dehalococcoidia bacterium]|nr:antibiotic biosynthesis monooxygenase [Dehalococcoidia bacterium]